MNIKLVESLIDRDPDEAARLCNLALNDDPDNAVALYYLGRIFSQASRYGLSANLYKRVTELHPEDAASWNNLGYAFHTIGKYDEAEKHFRKALSLDSGDWHAHNNMTTLMAARVRPHEAIDAGKYALFFANSDEERAQTLENLALTQLGMKNWKDGWENFEYGLGKKWRRERQYFKEGRWDGSPGKKVVFYGEQGIGDEIMFASMLPDALEDADGIIECDQRLAGLMRRTFPQATVHGTRHDKDISWPDPSIDARCAFGSLGKYYRRTSESFPRQPFLIPCPDRRKMYRALLDSLPGRKIGIAWTGGTKITRTEHRSLEVERVEKLARESYDVSFVSLEYKDTGSPGGVHHFPFATRTNDYDDTAALVAELDGVISVTTAVALLAGSIGTPCEVLVPKEPTWHWGYEGSMPWFDLNLHRGDWDLEGILNGVGTAHTRPHLSTAAQ